MNTILLNDSYAIKEKCGVFGIYGKGLEAARLTYFGLYSLQHRGQESSGISTADGKTIRTHKATGLVTQVYTEPDLQKLKGYIAIGHNRYSTSGGSISDHNQPVAGKNDIVALVHNGNLPVTKKLVRFLSSRGLYTQGLNDSELIHLAIKYFVVKKHSLEEAIIKSYPLFTGAFCLLVMTKDNMVAVRDHYGIRPLSIGRVNGGYVIASETCAIDTVDGEYIRDVLPGEMIVISNKGMKSCQIATPNQKLDIFEFVYFSRPDSLLLGKRVYSVRRNLGKELAKEYPIKADIVIPVPDSSMPAALGYSSELNLPCEFGLVKNRYIWRTFIMPGKRLRGRSVKMKHNAIPEVIKGKKVVLIDDSIVRGTTAKTLVRTLRDAGAKEVHILSSCPPIRYPDFYGIDTPTQKELIASHKTVLQIEKHIGADSLYFLSYKGLIKAVGLPESIFCTSCFTGNYPISIGKHANKIKTPASKM